MFLGTDENGWDGEAIFMNAEDFVQSMSHSKALELGILESQFNASVFSQQQFDNFASLQYKIERYVATGDIASFADYSQMPLATGAIESDPTALLSL